jgi:hypothetical protein
MNFTKHSLIRSQQRCIPLSDIEIILSIGSERKMPGNAVEYCILRKDIRHAKLTLKRMINKLDKISNKAVLVCGESIITVYNNKKR